MNQTQIPTLAILAGGAGTRMGIPKAQIQLSKLPILQFLLQQMSWKGPTLLVTSPGRHHPPGSQLFTIEAIDDVADQGPLRGLITALRASPTPWLIATTVDMPEIRHEHLQWLAEQIVSLHASGKQAMMLQAAQRIEPFPSLWSMQMTSTLQESLDQDQRSVHNLATHGNVACLPAPNWSDTTWTNLNDSKDLANWMATKPPQRP